MNILDIDTGYGDLLLFADRIYDGHDFFIKANSPPSALEVVLFFDSRGISKDWEDFIETWRKGTI
jgi:hypothetical protein